MLYSFCPFCSVSEACVPSAKLTLPAVRIIYAVVVLIKLYLAAMTPGEVGAILREKNLNLEELLANLEKAFENIMERDRLSPHTKFLYVIRRLNERFHNIKLGQSKKVACGEPNAPATPGPAAAARPSSAQGLQILSEAAVASPQHGGSASAPAVTPVNASVSPASTRTSAGPHAASVQQQQQQQQHQQRELEHQQHMQHMQQQQLQQHHHHQQQQAQQQAQHQHQQHQQAMVAQGAGWYPAANDPAADMAAAPGTVALDNGGGCSFYDFPGHLVGLEGFDYGLGGLGMGVDGAITGMFMENGGLWGMSGSMGGMWLGTGGWQG